MTVLGAVVSRVDSWVNAMTGLGTLRDKVTHAQIVPGEKLQDATLESLYNGDDLARRLVNKIPREATRRGFKITLEGTDDDSSADRARELMDQWNALSATPKLREAWIWGRLYAGGAVLVGADDGTADTALPLNESAIREIRFLTVLKRPQLRIKQRYGDIAQPKYGEPEIYEVWAPRDGVGALQETGVYVHESRLILFEGVKAARTYITSNDGWEDSVLQPVEQQLKYCATAWQSVSHLLADASQGVLSIHGLMDMIAAKGESMLRTRVQMMDIARSVCRSILLDAEKEKFERVATSFAGIPEILDRMMMRVAASFDMPVTLLFGRSPAGMNATGESDIRGFYDNVGDEQTDTLKPRVERLLKLMMLAKNSPTRGKVPERWEVVFLPLWQPTDKEHADVLKVKADTHAVLVEKEIMFPAEAALGLAADFPTIDQEHRQELLDADLEEGLRPGEGGSEDDVPDDPNGDGGDDDDGGGGGRTDGHGWREDRTYTREPKGSKGGGRFAKKSGVTTATVSAPAPTAPKPVVGGANAATPKARAPRKPRASGPQSATTTGARPAAATSASASKPRKTAGATADKKKHLEAKISDKQKSTVEKVKNHAAEKAAVKTKEADAKQHADVKAKLGGSEPGSRKTVKEISVDDGAPTGARALEIAPQHFDAAHAKAIGTHREQIANPANKRHEDIARYKGEAAAAVGSSMGASAGQQAKSWTNDWVQRSTPELADKVVAGMGKKGSWVQGYYHATQAGLKAQLHGMQKAGIADKDGYLTLYRGVSGKGAAAAKKGTVGSTIDLGVRGVSSWSSDPHVAKKFAKDGGAVVAQKVHYSRVFASHHGNSAGDALWRSEREFVVLAPEGKVTAKLHSLP